MSVVTKDDKATLRQWHEELQEKRGLRASLRRSKTVNDACLAEGLHSLLMQTHSLWKNKAPWNVTALAITAALAAHIKFIDEQKEFCCAAWTEERWRHSGDVKITLLPPISGKNAG